MRSLHVGLVGGGGITDTHARAALCVPELTIAAVQGANADKVAAICTRHGGVPYTDYRAFLGHRPLDLVVIGSPSGLHARQGILAAQAGLHVLVEKPIDIGTAAADALIEAADGASVQLGVIFQDRFKPGPRAVRRLLEEGRLGTPILVDARVPWYRPPEYYSASRWRGRVSLDGGGALINQAIHTLDLLIWLLGDVSRVDARTATLLHAIEAEDSGVAILEFASGALGSFTFSTAAYPGWPRRVALTGTAGTVVLEGDEIVQLALTAGPETDAGARLGLAAGEAAAASPRVSEAAASPLVTDIEPHRAVIEDFVGAIREGRAPRCDGREGRRSLALVEAIYRSARASQPVILAE